MFRSKVTIAAFLVSGLALAALAVETLYTVRTGDSLDRIARAHNTSVQAIVQLNGLENPNSLSVGQKLRVPENIGGADVYIVKSGDTLGAIATDHGVGVLALANFNHLEDGNSLRPGQLLKIPKPGAQTGGTPDAGRYPLGPDLKRKLDALKVVRGKWRYIVVHHSASSAGSAKSMDLYHRQKRHMENGLAYHFVIGNGRGMKDGEIAIGKRWTRQIKGGHLASTRLNEISIGICLVGNFENTRPTPQQLKSLYALVNYLEERCQTKPDAVKIHRQINTKPTKCPGRNFPTQSLQDNT
jgi:LysM repeat protein